MPQSITKARSLLVFVALLTSAAALFFTLRTAMTSPNGLGFWNRTSSDGELAFPIIAEREIEAVPTTVAVVGDAADITFDAGGKGLVLDGNGAIYRLAGNGTVDSIPFLVLRNEHSAQHDRARFNSLALHPGFLIPDTPGYGKFYTIEPEIAGTADADYSPEFGTQLGEHHQDVLYEYTAADPSARVFNGSRRAMLRLSQPGADHNMADLDFDRAGFLLVAVGDGAAVAPKSNTPSRNAMSLANPYGKILRIDPLGDDAPNGRYGLPRRNPFRKVDKALGEIWCYGLRDPRRINYDDFRHWLSIGDVGQDQIEEINLSTTGGEHFGWDLCEGSYFYPPKPGARPSEGVTGPVAEIAKGENDHVLGGFVYHGNRFPVLREKLVFASQRGRLLYADPHRPGEAAREIVINSRAEFARHGITGLRPGPEGEILVLCGNGKIYQLDKASSLTEPSRSRRPLVCAIGF